MSLALLQITSGFNDAYRNASDDEDFVRSDYCTECEGVGFVFEEDKKEQCAECEHLHEQELRADRMMDEAKGN